MFARAYPDRGKCTLDSAWKAALLVFLVADFGGCAKPPWHDLADGEGLPVCARDGIAVSSLPGDGPAAASRRNEAKALPLGRRARVVWYDLTEERDPRWSISRSKSDAFGW